MQIIYTIIRIYITNAFIEKRIHTLRLTKYAKKKMLFKCKRYCMRCSCYGLMSAYVLWILKKGLLESDSYWAFNWPDKWCKPVAIIISTISRTSLLPIL